MTPPPPPRTDPILLAPSASPGRCCFPAIAAMPMLRLLLAASIALFSTVAADSCDTLPTCGACLANSGCGWCASSTACMSRTSEGALSGCSTFEASQCAGRPTLRRIISSCPLECCLESRDSAPQHTVVVHFWLRCSFDRGRRAVQLLCHVHVVRTRALLHVQQRERRLRVHVSLRPVRAPEGHHRAPPSACSLVRKR